MSNWELRVEVREIPISLLSENTGQIPDVPKNPRKITKEKFDALCESIRQSPEMKMLDEVKVYPYNGRFVVISGNHRYKGGNINLARAKELDPTVTELTLENAGDLIDKAGGVTVRVRAVTQQKFTDLLNAEGVKVQRVGVSELAYVAKKDGEGQDDNGGDDNGDQNGGQNNGGDDNGGGHVFDEG